METFRATDAHRRRRPTVSTRGKKHALHDAPASEDGLSIHSMWHHRRRYTSPLVRRAYVRLSRTDTPASPEDGGFARVLVSSILTPTLCTALIIWHACVTPVEPTELVGAILMDLALWAICTVTLIEIYQAARYRARRQQHIDALATQFADWVDAERATWSSHQ